MVLSEDDESDQSDVDRFEFTLQPHCCLVVVHKLVELVLVTDVQFTETEDPLIDVDGVLVADGRRLQEVIGILLSLGLSDVLIDVFVESDCLVQVDGLQIVEVDVVEDVCQFLLVVLGQHVEGLLLRDEGIAQETTCNWRYILASRVFSPDL